MPRQPAALVVLLVQLGHILPRVPALVQDVLLVLTV